MEHHLRQQHLATFVKYKLEFYLFTRAQAISTSTEEHSQVHDTGTGAFKMSYQRCIMGVQYGRLSKRRVLDIFHCMLCQVLYL